MYKCMLCINTYVHTYVRTYDLCMYTWFMYVGHDHCSTVYNYTITTLNNQVATKKDTKCDIKNGHIHISLM